MSVAEESVDNLFMSDRTSLQVSNMGEHFLQLKDALIMMVDDEPIMMELAQAFLEGEGYSRFHTQPDSKRAIIEIGEMRPDILLLDLNMPDVSGFDILAAMNGAELLKHIPVIVLTSSNDPADKLKALELGVTDFLAKPVDPSELALRLRNTLTVKAYQDQLAYYDALTGLPNRKLFLDRLDWALERKDREQGGLAVIDIGLDRFRQINQALGIKAGDALLKRVAERLMEQVRQGDVVSKRAASDMVRSLSRLGGDEFSILLTDMTRTENAEIVVRRLRSVFDTPFMLPGRNEITITASVGVAVYPDDGETSDQLIKNAGAASSFVKKQGGNGHQFFSDEVDARSRERVALEMDLRKAIGRGELEMHYQPKMSADGEQVVGVEALLRWKHSERGYISPMVFIPIAEEIGFISSIGDWVILTVCKQARAWLDEGITLESISLNVSPQQLHSGDLATFLKDTLQRNHLPDGLITVELTESLAMDSNMDGESILMSLKNAGVNLSIDDFGTGYSNLGYLKQLPFDELKIDRSFLNNIPSDSDEVAIVSAITTMSHALGLKVVAEGVEESEQHEFLRDLGVETIQGFLFSKPLPSNEVSAFIKSKNNVQ